MGPLIMFLILSGIWKASVWTIKAMDWSSAMLYKKFRNWLWFRAGVPAYLSLFGLLKMYFEEGTISEKKLIARKEKLDGIRQRGIEQKAKGSWQSRKLRKEAHEWVFQDSKYNRIKP